MKVNTVRSYFKPVESPISLALTGKEVPVHAHSDVENSRTSLSLNIVHVQQRTDDEAMWNLYPSFVLKWLDPENCSISPDIGQWQYNFGHIQRETEEQVNTVLVG